jgi:hypothetical protein
LFNRFFGREKKEPAEAQAPVGGHKPHPRPFPEGAVCGAGCGRTEGYHCSYSDGSGRRCEYWCEEHSVFLNGRMWCQRHANSVKWLRARDGSIYEIGHTAALEDRSPNLAGILVDELNPEMTAYLRSSFKGQSDVHIVTDGHVRTASIPKGRVEHTPDGPVVLSEGGQSAWERGWGVYSHVGYLARVVLRVTSSEPPVVYVFANGSLVLRRIPDWIANRGKGTNPQQDHADFKHAVLAAVQRVIIGVAEQE